MPLFNPKIITEQYTNISAYLTSNDDPNQFIAGGLSLLTAASFHNLKGIVAILLKNQAKMNHKDDFGRSPLMWAAKKGRIGIVRLLLDAGAEIELQDEDGNTAFMLAAQAGNLKTASLLLNHQANINAQNKLGDRALNLAIQKNHLDIVKLILNNHFIIDINAQNTLGYTALIIACEYGNIKIVRQLLRHGALVHLANINGCTALMIASDCGYLAIASLLINKKADLSAQSAKGYTALMMAILRGHTEVIHLILNNAHLGLNIHLSDSEGDTALIFASRFGRKATVLKLLKLGAAIEDSNDYGMTALLEAAEAGHKDIIIELIKAGADIHRQSHFDLDAHMNHSALSLAIDQGQKEIVILLIKAGARMTKNSMIYCESLMIPVLQSYLYEDKNFPKALKFAKRCIKLYPKLSDDIHWDLANYCYSAYMKGDPDPLLIHKALNYILEIDSSLKPFYKNFKEEVTSAYIYGRGFNLVSDNTKTLSETITKILNKSDEDPKMSLDAIELYKEAVENTQSLRAEIEQLRGQLRKEPAAITHQHDTLKRRLKSDNIEAMSLEPEPVQKKRKSAGPA